MTETEREQMQRLVTLQKVVLVVVARWAWLFALVFAVLFGSFAAYLAARGAKSVGRFTATTKLLYNPRKVADIETISDRQILSILDRASLKRRIGDKVPMQLAERECLAFDLSIKQEKKPTNLFTLTAASQSWKGAVKKVNAYAETLIDEYAAYRAKDLDTWSASLQGRKAKLLDELAGIEADEAKLKARTGVMSPQEALIALNAFISDLRKNASALGVDYTNEDLKKRRLEKQVGKAGMAITEHAAVIRRKSEAITAIDRELVALREKYTDMNPKVTGKLEEREQCVADMKAFLKSKGVEDLNLEDLDMVEKLSGELSDCIIRMAAISEKRRAVEQEIKDNEKRASEAAAMIPDYEHLQTHRADVTAAIRDLDEKIGNISYQTGTLKNDLRQIERTGGAGDKGPFGAKQLALSLGGSLVCTLVAMLWVVALELVFGKVRGGREISAYGGIAFLGSLPRPGLMPADEDSEVMGVVALKMFLEAKDSPVVLVCRLDGAEMRGEFAATVGSMALMSGVNCFMLNVVSGAGFTPPEGSEQMIGVVRKDAFGWFPTVNRFAMAPPELQILKADLEGLKATYGNVFVKMEDGVRTGGTFFDQLLELCDAVLLEVGAGTTPRSAFSYVRRHVKSSGKTIMALAAGADARTVRREMETRK
ncbi:MAG: hypothetical protein J6T51_04015 [Kiritimatiellae bacterium]|nr:hypothetical protein [Kiritimatiellia bacterium]